VSDGYYPLIGLDPFNGGGESAAGDDLYGHELDIDGPRRVEVPAWRYVGARLERRMGFGDAREPYTFPAFARIRVDGIVRHQRCDLALAIEHVDGNEHAGTQQRAVLLDVDLGAGRTRDRMQERRDSRDLAGDRLLGRRVADDADWGVGCDIAEHALRERDRHAHRARVADDE
jgi:hypothetical protein